MYPPLLRLLTRISIWNQVVISLVLLVECVLCAKHLLTTDRKPRLRKRVPGMLINQCRLGGTLTVVGTAGTSSCSPPNSPAAALSAVGQGPADIGGGRKMGDRLQLLCWLPRRRSRRFSERVMHGNSKEEVISSLPLPVTSPPSSQCGTRGTGGFSPHTPPLLFSFPCQHLSALTSLLSSKLFLGIH